MTLYKHDLHNWVRTKRNELCDKKLKPLEDAKKAEFIKAANAILKKSRLDLDEISEGISKMMADVATVRDELVIHYGVINRFSYELQGGNTPENIKANIIDNMIIGGGVSKDLDKARLDYDEMGSLINDEIRKLESIVNNNPSKRALKIFDDLGFDVDDLKTKAGLKKLELQVTDFNSQLFDLPEKTVEEIAAQHEPTIEVVIEPNGVVKDVKTKKKNK